MTMIRYHDRGIDICDAAGEWHPLLIACTKREVDNCIRATSVRDTTTDNVRTVVVSATAPMRWQVANQSGKASRSYRHFPIVRAWQRRFPDSPLTDFAYHRFYVVTSTTSGDDTAISTTIHVTPTGKRRAKRKAAGYTTQLQEVLEGVIEDRSYHEDDFEQAVEQAVLCVETPEWSHYYDDGVPPRWIRGEIQDWRQSASESFDPGDYPACDVHGLLDSLDLNPERRSTAAWAIYPAAFTLPFHGTLRDVMRQAKKLPLTGEWLGLSKELSARIDKFLGGLHMLTLLYAADDIAETITIAAKSPNRYASNGTPRASTEFDEVRFVRDYGLPEDEETEAKLIKVHDVLKGVGEELADLIDDVFRYAAKQIEEDYDYQTSDQGIIESYGDSIFSVDTMTQWVIQEIR